MSIGNANPIVIQRQGDWSYRVYYGLQIPQHYFRDVALDLRNLNATRDMLLSEVYADWSEEYKDIVRHATDLRAWTLHTLSTEELSWKPSLNTTLIGDAAHLAYPGGSGVNLAMLDSLHLAAKIDQHGISNVDQAIREYEADMFPRGIKAIAEGKQMSNVMFSETPNAFLELLAGGDH